MGGPTFRFAGTDSLAAFHAVATDEDVARALLDGFAAAADVLAAYQEQVAEESYLPTGWDAERRRVRIELPAEVLPALCVVAGGPHTVFVVVGRESGEATVVFGEGAHGERPGGGGVTVQYLRGGGGSGELAITGVPFEAPLLVLAIPAQDARARRICATRSGQA